MREQVIDIQGKWKVTVCYGRLDFVRLKAVMLNFGIPPSDVSEALDVLSSLNTGYTFSDLLKRQSLTVIGEATSDDQLLNTAAHEIKHLQSHICNYYGVDEASEDAAYLVGFLAQKFYTNYRS